jgi:benzoyl-CoA reductase subunit C
MQKEKIISRFREIAQDPYTYLHKLKTDTGKPMIGSICAFTPEEFILAAGAHPFRIFGQSDSLAGADAHFQAYSCSMVRGMLEDGLSGKLDFADGVVFPHTCDSIQRLSDIWRLNIKSLHFDVLLPVKLDTPLAKNYFTKVLQRFQKDLEKALQIEIKETDLHEAIILMNRLRRRLIQLYEWQSDYPGILLGSDLSAIVKACMVMEKQETVTLLDELLDVLEKEPVSNKNAKRLLISGSICSHPDIYRMIEEKGAVVVWDDLCSGSRYFEGLADEEKNPVEAIAGRFTERYVCPAKHLGVKFQMENLKKQVKEHKIDGILFMLLKFCEPFSFDYPDIKTELEKMEIPFLLVEMDRHNEVDEQMRTRIDTMLEIL